MHTDSLDLRLLMLINLVDIEHLALWFKVIFCTAFFFFAAATLLPFLRENLPQSKSKWLEYLSSDAVYLVTMILLILAGRWPTLLRPLINPDEGQFLAGAQRLWHHPLFWRSVDCGSSGPLNVYPLMVPAIFGFRLEYASARVVAFFFLFIALISCYFSILILYSRKLARFVFVLITITFATLDFYDFIHFGSEYVSIAILSLALLLMTLNFTRPRNNLLLIAFTGLLLGMLPFAKMQAVLIGMILAAICAHIVWSKNQTRGELFKNFGTLVFSGCAATMFVAILLFSFQIFDDFWKSYIRQNLLYYSSQGVNLPEMSPFGFVRFFFGYATFPDCIRPLNTLASAFLVMALPLMVITFFVRKPDENRLKTSRYLYYSTALLLTTIYVVIKPGSYFFHYLLFLLLPAGFIIGIGFGELLTLAKNINFKPVQKKISLGVCALLAAGLVGGSFFRLYQYVSVDNPNIVAIPEYLSNYSSPLKKILLEYGNPGDSMVVWGDAIDLYVGTDMVQGVRDARLIWQIQPHPQQEYYLKRFVDDMLESKAHLFVDATAPGMFDFVDHSKFGIDNFPLVHEAVNNNYHFVREFRGVRIYVRNQ